MILAPKPGGMHQAPVGSGRKFIVDNLPVSLVASDSGLKMTGSNVKQTMCQKMHKPKCTRAAACRMGAMMGANICRR